MIRDASTSDQRNVADVATPPTIHYYMYVFGSAIRRYLNVQDMRV